MTRDRVREEAFQAALEGRGTPGSAADRRMLALAAALGRGSADAMPAPDFQAVLRRRIILEAEKAARLPWRERFALVVAQRNEAMRRSFRVVSAVGLAAMLLIGSGAVLALAADAKPGDALYPVKRGTEAARLAVTRGAIPRGYLQLEFSRRRLNEVRALSAAHVTQVNLYVDTLNDMDSSELAATDLLVKASRLGAGTRPLEVLSKFAIAQRLRLESMVEELPTGARPAARDSLTVLVRLSDRVLSIEAGCTCPSNPLEVPQAAVNQPGVVTHGGQSLPCTCSTRGNGPTFNGTRPNTNDDHGRIAPPPPGPPQQKGVKLLDGTPAAPADSALDSVLKTLGLPTPSVLTTPLPTPAPVPSAPSVHVP